MTTIASTSLDAAFAELRGRVAGPVLDPRSPGYDEVRQVWNGAVDRRPAVIIRCSSTADVVEAIRFARGAGLPIAVRGGGHSIPGLCICDDGVLIDLQPMKIVEVDAERRLATAGAGVV